MCGGVKDGPSPLCTSHGGHACYLRRVDRTGGQSMIEYSRREGFILYTSRSGTGCHVGYVLPGGSSTGRGIY